MTIVVHEFQGSCGHTMRVAEVVHTPFRVLLRGQRLAPVQAQWAGHRFRVWRREFNNHAQRAADHAAIVAFLEQPQPAGPELRVIQGGRTDEPDYAYQQAVRQRWREADGFARLDP